MVTTIQLNENVKERLDKFKDSAKQTYEEIILQLMRFVEMYRRKQRELLIEECKEMKEDITKINKEWAVADLDWE